MLELQASHERRLVPGQTGALLINMYKAVLINIFLGSTLIAINVNSGQNCSEEHVRRDCQCRGTFSVSQQL